MSNGFDSLHAEERGYKGTSSKKVKKVFHFQNFKVQCKSISKP